ncbi:MAG: DNA-binding protein [Candidatus Heimdallarchaeota archaeon]|nr:DNA-binding protein [Candidatus Heimdallarchaeota archaeon]MDH5645017.1 DNA-binding protein [Candidatus Heimdallarchaeota archaeon]
MSDELDEIRQRKLRDIQERNAHGQSEEELRRQEEAKRTYEMQKQTILRGILTDSAKQRLNNIKLVKPALADAIENQLIQLSQMGRIPNGIINEEQLLQMLKQIQNKRRDSNIKFKRV